MEEPMSGVRPETEPEPGTGPGEPVPGGTEGPGERSGADGGPRPLGVGVAPTGHPGVDARLGRLADADHLAVAEHMEVYEDVHRGLHDMLTALDQRPGPPAPGAPDSGS